MLARTSTGALSLLEDYRTDASLFFASPHGSLLAGPPVQTIPDRVDPDRAAPERPGGERRELLARATALAGRSSVIVGAVPFDRSAPAHLMVPRGVRRAEPLRAADASAALADPPRTDGEYEVQAVPSPQDHAQGVARALDRLRAGGLTKVVLARSLRLRARRPISARPILRNLALRDPGGYTFAVRLPSADGGQQPGGVPRERVLLGASPELLVAKTGDQVVANPLAGSAARVVDPADDERRGAELLASAKDRHEHAVVVDAVAAALRPFCPGLHVPAAPELVRTATMWHLSTRITGTLPDPGTSSLTLALALHPTPAVCGTPTADAYRTIAEIEPFDRGFYAGVVGWCDAHGDGEWVVAIRCAELTGRSLRLFAGGGIVAGSDPRTEVAETTAKFRTLLHAVGADQEIR